MGTRSQRFEALLDRTRGALDRARYEHQSIDGAVPDEFVAALQGFERRLEALETVGRIDDSDFEAAEFVNRRAEVLEDLLVSLGEFDADVVEYDVRRLRILVDYLSDVADESAGSSLQDRVSAVEERVSLFETLIDSDKGSKVRSNDQFTWADVECEVRDLDAALSRETDDDAYRACCLDCAEALFDRVHDLLADLEETNPERTAFGDQVKAVKSRSRRAREEADTDAARAALEGATMVHYSVARARCRQAHAKRLTRAIVDNDIPSEDDPDELARNVDVEALVDVIAAGVSAEIEQSRETRLRRLLSEHDGSVERTIAATDYERSEVFDLLEAMFEEGPVADLSVTFER